MRRILAVLAAVSLLAACAPAGTIPAAAGGQTAWGARLSCTTSTAGVCTVPHDMGVVPDAVTANLADRAGFAQVTGKSAAGITLKAIKSVNSSGTPTVWASVSVTFELTAVYIPAAPTTPPVTTPPTTVPTTAPTTVSPMTTPPTTEPTTNPPAGWPDASNTGVPPGTALTAYTGPCTITSATTIDAKTVDCTDIVVRAALTITNSKVNGGIWLDTDLAGADGWSLTLYDSEVDKGLAQIAAVCCGNLDIRRSDIHGGVTSVQCEEKSLSCYVADSWLHGQQIPDTANWHLGGFLSDGTRGAGCSGTWCMELVHNRVVCDHPVNSVGEGCTGDINLIPNFATMSKVRISGNLLGANIGSAFCTYGGERSDGAYPHGDHIVYEGNRFEPGSNGQCAAYGPVNAFNVNGTGNVWTDNTWTTGGAVPPVD